MIEAFESMLPLSLQTVHLYTLRDDPVLEPALPRACMDLLAPEERAHLDRLRLPKVRREYVLARTLVRTTLSRYVPVPPTAWRFIAGSHGRPEVGAPAGLSRLRFNLSHTGGMLSLGVMLERDIGVDVENTFREIEDDRIAERFFAPSEAADVIRSAGGERRERFFGYWTLKEAYIKARGLGLAIPLRHFWFTLDADPIPIGFAPELGDDPRIWQFARFRPTAEHALAVAVRRGTGPDVAIELKPMATIAALFDWR